MAEELMEIENVWAFEWIKTQHELVFVSHHQGTFQQWSVDTPGARWSRYF